MLVLVPAAKTWQVIASKPWVSDAQRQLLIAAVLSLVTIWLVRRVRPDSSMGPWKRWFVAVGLWPDAVVADNHKRTERRWVLALASIGPAAAATLPMSDSWFRWVAASGAAACLFAQTVVELVRRRPNADTSTAERTPTMLWISVPIVLSCLGTAIALGVRSDSTSLSVDRFTELVIVTALGEEFIFRGCLLVLAARALPSRAVSLVTALSFGAWHVGDAWTSSGGDRAISRAVHIAGTVLVTFVGGLVFTFVRRRSRSLAGPILAHVATNLPGIALRHRS
jgi:membrane protease YdiL (CAAX protease family)